MVEPSFAPVAQKIEAKEVRQKQPVGKNRIAGNASLLCSQ